MNSLGSSNEIVQNKLIIMYIIDRLNIPVGNNAITRLVLETRLMNYFVFQQCFNELLEGKLLLPFPDHMGGQSAKSTTSPGHMGGQLAKSAASPEVNHPQNTKSANNYMLSDTGRSTLQYFLNLIPQGLKMQLDKTITGSRSGIQHDSLVTADFTPESENNYTVVCKIDEKGFSLIELKAAAGSKKDARAICENWKKHSTEIYGEIMASLIKKRE
jgi:hypothetical protein